MIRRGGRTHRIHRWAWEQAHGPIPNDLCVLHRCDNRSCYSVDHLFLGTKGDNNRDRDEKGRHFTTLTEDQVRAIRNRWPYETERALAAAFGISPSHIYRIATRKARARVE